MSKKNVIAESSLDDLIKDVNSAWDLAMKKLKKNDDKDDDDSDAPKAPEKEAAPAADAGAPAAGQEGVAPGADAGAPAGAPGADAGMSGADAGAADPAAAGAPGADAGAPGAGADGMPGADGQNPDQQLEQEGQQGQDGEISDEELQQIYGSMDPQELERHYMILRGILRDQYQKAEGAESAKEMDKCGEMTSMSKSEKMVIDENAALKAKIQELEKSTDGLLKAVKILSQPTRKAATMAVQVLNKSEDGLTTGDDLAPLSKSEIKDRLTQICKTNMTLTKSERDLANRYFINGSNELEVLKLIGAKS